VVEYEWQFEVLTDVKKLHCGFNGNIVIEYGDITSVEMPGISHQVIIK
jgi:hypothetical protein